MRSYAAQRLPLNGGLIQPITEADLAESSDAGGNQGAPAELGAKVPCVWVRHDLAGVVARPETLTDQLIEAELLWTGHFDRAIDRCAHGDPADSLGDVLGRYWLDEHGRQP